MVVVLHRPGSHTCARFFYAYNLSINTICSA
nr:MAG TPA: hypothetical protein [Caudoviricetes sp.]